MSRTLSPAALSQLALLTTFPGALIEMLYPSPVRLSTLGDIEWNGLAWLGGRVAEFKPAESGSIDVVDGDFMFATLALAEQAVDVDVNIWGITSDAPALDDPVLIFQGAVSGASGEDSSGRVRFSLLEQNARTALSPRLFIGPQTGFNHLAPTGKRITWGGQTIVLGRNG